MAAEDHEDPASAPVRGTVRHLTHEPGLDGLRGVAVLLVVVYHVPDILQPVPFVPTFNGTLGVDLFFVLSGFLITAILISEHDRGGRVQVGSFYLRRALRLLPALTVLLLAFVVYAWVTHLDSPFTRVSVTSTALFVSNWQSTVHLQMSPYLGHLWSLSIEEQFYLLWPLVVLVLATFVRRVGVVVGVLSVSIVAVAVHRAMLYDGLTNPFAALLLYPRTDVRADALLVGALFAHLWVHRWTPRRGLGPAAWIALVALAVCISRTWELDPFLFHGGFTLVALAGGVLVLATVERGWAGARVLRWRVLGVVGLVSYGLYLWHAPVFIAVERYGGTWPPVIRVVVALTITGAAVTTSWFLVERPALRRKARLDPGAVTPVDREDDRSSDRGVPAQE